MSSWTDGINSACKSRSLNYFPQETFSDVREKKNCKYNREDAIRDKRKKNTVQNTVSRRPIDVED